MVAVWSGPAPADDSPAVWSGAKTVGRRAKQSTTKLKWLPYRPSKPRRADRVIPVAHADQVTPVAEVRTAQQGPFSPLRDPFGDLTPGPSPAPAGTLKDNSLQEPTAEPEFQAVPDFPAEGLTAPGEVTAPDDEFTVQPLTRGVAGRNAGCPRSEDVLKAISEVGVDIEPKVDLGKGDELPPECRLTERQTIQRDTWVPTTFTWKASGLCHKPLYFEDVHLERYGHSWGPYIQPIISGGHFFLTVPVLPYKMGLYPPGECIYTLGYYRPGSCAPYLLDPLPLSVRAGLAEAGAWTGMAYLIP